MRGIKAKLHSHWKFLVGLSSVISCLVAVIGLLAQNYNNSSQSPRIVVIDGHPYLEGQSDKIDQPMGYDTHRKLNDEENITVEISQESKERIIEQQGGKNLEGDVKNGEKDSVYVSQGVPIVSEKKESSVTESSKLLSDDDVMNIKNNANNFYNRIKK